MFYMNNFFFLASSYQRTCTCHVETVTHRWQHKDLMRCQGVRTILDLGSDFLPIVLYFLWAFQWLMNVSYALRKIFNQIFTKYVYSFFFTLVVPNNYSLFLFRISFETEIIRSREKGCFFFFLLSLNFFFFALPLKKKKRQQL